jgi:hypothetical protein
MSRVLRLRLLALVVSLASIAFIGGVGAGTGSAAPPDVQGNKTTANVHGKADNGAVFNGKYTITSFQQGATADAVNAVGTLTGKWSGPGAPAGDVNQPNVQMPVNQQATQASCQILDLVLGPLDLDLLGLTVHLDTVHLNITAVPGAGNLLGNLLCAVAGLLDGTGQGSLLDLLNDILGQLLGGLGG